MNFKTNTYRPLFLNSILAILLAMIFTTCKQKQQTKEVFEPSEVLIKKIYETIGMIERVHPDINLIIPKSAVIEVLSDKLEWAEGPLWVSEKQWLLCSDVKENKIYKWSEVGGFELYLDRSGFTGDSTDSRERGSNGLALDAEGNLIICQHGNRQVVRMDANLEDPKVDFTPLATHYQGKRFNSPNDLIYDSKGNMYFTDPPYGLSEAMMNDPKKELSFQGVYKVNSKGEIVLLTNRVSRPNGLAFSPDEKILYIANTDSVNAAWLAFPVKEDGSLGEMEEILNVSDLIGKEIGYPDGIKVDKNGNIFTAGPGGLWIFNSKHQLMGKIKPGEWVSNCAFDETYKTLYITADNYLLRVQLQKP